MPEVQLGAYQTVHPMVTCCECGIGLIPGCEVRAGSGEYCPTCAACHLGVCHACQLTLPVDQLHIGAELSHTYCDACHEELPVCVGCGEYSDNLFGVANDGEVCATCILDYSTCCNCGDRHPTEDCTESLHGDVYCEDCADELLITCEGCGDQVEIDSTASVGGQVWCESCTDLRAVTCDSCSELTAIYERDEHLTICSSCYEEGYITCATCGQLVSMDDSNSDDWGSYCESCWEEHHTAQIHCYSYKPYPITHGTGLQLGVELEVACGPDCAEETLELLGGEDHVYLKSDCSIGEGFEIVSHPHDLAHHRTLWNEFFANRPSGMTSWNAGTCGIHVHVDRRKLTELHVRKIVVFVNAAWNSQFIRDIAQRDSERWAARKLKTMSHGRDSAERYEAVNVTPPTTIEFRIFRGTLRHDRFMKDVEFVDAVVKWTKDRSYKELEYQRFIDWVARLRRDYPHLYGYLKEKNWVSRRTVACV